MKKANLKSLFGFINTVDSDMSSQPLKRHRRFNADLLSDFVEEHIEIQSAILAIQGLENIDYTIYTNCINNNEYGEKLCMLFNYVMHLKSKNFSDRFIVSDCNKEALIIYNKLKKEKKLNRYIELFENHKSNTKNYGEYKVYKIAVHDNCRQKDKFIDCCLNSFKANPYIALNVCGFTLEEIKENPSILNLISFFPDVYIIFCGKYSEGAYIFNEKYY